jgi:hypothetical protein
MSEKRIPAEINDGGEVPHRLEDDVAERGVLSVLMNSETPGLWSEAEVARELGDRLAVIDAICALQAAGLVHRCQGFVFPTRAAARFDKLEQS